MLIAAIGVAAAWYATIRKPSSAVHLQTPDAAIAGSADAGTVSKRPALASKPSPAVAVPVRVQLRLDGTLSDGTEPDDTDPAAVISAATRAVLEEAALCDGEERKTAVMCEKTAPLLSEECAFTTDSSSACEAEEDLIRRAVGACLEAAKVLKAVCIGEVRQNPAKAELLDNFYAVQIAGLFSKVNGYNGNPDNREIPKVESFEIFRVLDYVNDQLGLGSSEGSHRAFFALLKERAGITPDGLRRTLVKIGTLFIPSTDRVNMELLDEIGLELVYASFGGAMEWGWSKEAFYGKFPFLRAQTEQ